MNHNNSILRNRSCIFTQKLLKISFFLKKSGKILRNLLKNKSINFIIIREQFYIILGYIVYDFPDFQTNIIEYKEFYN